MNDMTEWFWIVQNWFLNFCQVSARVLGRLGFLPKCYGWGDCVFSGACSASTGNLRRLTSTCTMICTWRWRVMFSRTSVSLWRASTSPRLRRQEKRHCPTSLRRSGQRTRPAGRGNTLEGRNAWPRYGFQHPVNFIMLQKLFFLTLQLKLTIQIW